MVMRSGVLFANGLCREVEVQRHEEQDDGETHGGEAGAFDNRLFLVVELGVALCVREHERDGEQRVHDAAERVEARPAGDGDEQREDRDGHEDVVLADFFRRLLLLGLLVEIFLQFAILFCHEAPLPSKK